MYKMGWPSFLQEGYVQLYRNLGVNTIAASRVFVESTGVVVVNYFEYHLDYLKFDKSTLSSLNSKQLLSSVTIEFIGGISLLNSTYFITTSANNYTKGYLILLSQDLSSVRWFQYDLHSFWQLLLFQDHVFLAGYN